MAEPYLKELTIIVERVSAAHEKAVHITCKHFFSGAAAYVDGHIFMSLSPVGLALKLSRDDCELLLGQGGQPLRYFPKAPVKKGYVVLPDQFMDDESLSGWMVRSIDYVQH